MTQGTQPGLGDNLQGWEVGGKRKREETYIHLWLMYVDIGRKPTQYCNYPSIKRK